MAEVERAFLCKIAKSRVYPPLSGVELKVTAKSCDCILTQISFDVASYIAAAILARYIRCTGTQGSPVLCNRLQFHRQTYFLVRCSLLMPIMRTIYCWKYLTKPGHNLQTLPAIRCHEKLFREHRVLYNYTNEDRPWQHTIQESKTQHGFLFQGGTADILRMEPAEGLQRWRVHGSGIRQ